MDPSVPEFEKGEVRCSDVASASRGSLSPSVDHDASLPVIHD
jgi:hypothetical protein